MSFDIILPSPDDGSLERKRYSVNFLTLNSSLSITLFYNFSLYCWIHQRPKTVSVDYSRIEYMRNISSEINI